MAYLPNIPTGPQRFKDSQPQIQGNFGDIKTLIDVNHVTFDDPSGDQGKHKFVSFPVQAVAPTFLATEEGLYNKLSGTGAFATNLQELFVHKQNFGATTSEVPFTASILGTAAPTGPSTGWTYLASGIIMQWQNNVAAAAVMNDPHAFPKAFPNACLVVLVCPSNSAPSSGIAIGSTPATTTTFYTRAGNVINFNYIAIGY